MAEYTSKGDVWKAKITPNDGYGAGVATELLVEIANTPAGVDSISITPSEGVYTNSELRCEAQGSDLDGDDISFSYSWQRLASGEVIWA